MAFKVFFDANIILDFALGRADAAVAERLLLMAESRAIHGYITPSVIAVVSYFLVKAFGKRKAKELVIVLAGYVTVIDIDHATTMTALYSKIDDVEDALNYFSAVQHKLDYFITNDKVLIKSAMPVLPVVSPEEFLRKISA